MRCRSAVPPSDSSQLPSRRRRRRRSRSAVSTKGDKEQQAAAARPSDKLLPPGDRGCFEAGSRMRGGHRGCFAADFTFLFKHTSAHFVAVVSGTHARAMPSSEDGVPSTLCTQLLDGGRGGRGEGGGGGGSVAGGRGRGRRRRRGMQSCRGNDRRARGDDPRSGVRSE